MRLAATLRLAAAGKAAAGLGAGILVDAEFEAEGMDGGGHGLHALRKQARIGLQIALTVARLQHPTIVDGDRVVATRRKPRLDQRAGVRHDRRRSVIALIVSPVVPAHRGRRGQSARSGRAGVRSRPGDKEREQNCRKKRHAPAHRASTGRGARREDRQGRLL